MKINTSDYISKAEGIHSSELSYEAKIEQLTNRKNDLESSIQRAQYRLESLYSRLAALECSDDDEEDNSAEISAIMAEISETNFELQEYATEQREVQYEISDASQSLREVQSKKRQMLGEIETLAATTSKNASALNALGGDYANVINRATSGLQNNMSNLAHAAQILGGSVSNTISGGAGGYHGYSSGAKSHNASQIQSTTGQHHSEKKSVFGGTKGTSDNSQYQQSSNSNLYQDAESQRDAMYAKKRHSGGMGAQRPKSENGAFIPAETADFIQSEITEKPTKKKGGLFGRGEKKKNNSGEEIQDFHGLKVKKDTQSDSWTVIGNGNIAYSSYDGDRQSYTTDNSRYDIGKVKYIDPNSIEGIRITNRDMQNPDAFWNAGIQGGRKSYLEAASEISNVRNYLLQGYKRDDFKQNPALNKTLELFFTPFGANAPVVRKGDGFYEFVSGDPRVILAAKFFGVDIPVQVVEEIKSKKEKQSTKAAFAQSMKSQNFESHNTSQTIKDIRACTSKETLAEIATRNHIANKVDFGGLDLQVAKGVVESIFRTKATFPNLDIGFEFVGSMQKRNQYIERQTAMDLLRHYRTKYKSNNPNCTDREANLYAEKCRRAIMSKLTIQKGTIAQSCSAIDPNTHSEVEVILNKAAIGITINEGFGSNYKEFVNRKIDEVISGHKPEGCNSPKASIDHELGHAIAHALNAMDDPVILREYNSFMKLSSDGQAKTLSRYSKKNIGEFIAESWSEYQNNPECRSTARIISERMIELYHTVHQPPTSNEGFDHEERGPIER